MVCGWQRLGVLFARRIDAEIADCEQRCELVAFGGEGLLHWILVAEIWRGMFAAELLPAALFFLLLLIVPESPRWLVKEGRSEEAFEILKRLGGQESAHRQVGEIEE